MRYYFSILMILLYGTITFSADTIQRLDGMEMVGTINKIEDGRIYLTNGRKYSLLEITGITFNPQREVDIAGEKGLIEKYVRREFYLSGNDKGFNKDSTITFLVKEEEKKDQSAENNKPFPIISNNPDALDPNIGAVKIWENISEKYTKDIAVEIETTFRCPRTGKITISKQTIGSSGADFTKYKNANDISLVVTDLRKTLANLKDIKVSTIYALVAAKRLLVDCTAAADKDSDNLNKNKMKQYNRPCGDCAGKGYVKIGGKRKSCPTCGGSGRHSGKEVDSSVIRLDRTISKLSRDTDSYRKQVDALAIDYLNDLLKQKETKKPEEIAADIAKILEKASDIKIEDEYLQKLRLYITPMVFREIEKIKMVVNNKLCPVVVSAIDKMAPGQAQLASNIQPVQTADQQNKEDKLKEIHNMRIQAQILELQEKLKQENSPADQLRLKASIMTLELQMK